MSEKEEHDFIIGYLTKLKGLDPSMSTILVTTDPSRSLPLL